MRGRRGNRGYVFRARRDTGARVVWNRVFACGAVAVMGAMCLLGASCGTPEEQGDSILTIDQALAAGDGRTVRVEGMLVGTEDEQVLASVLLESYPPQAGGSRLVLKGLDLGALVALSSTRDRPESAQVVWSDYPVVLEGAVDSGTLEVSATPPAAEANMTEVRVRFSPGRDELASSGSVWWALEVVSLSAEAIDLIFPSGQLGDVILFREGTEVYRWSEDRAFPQVVRVSTLEPGRSIAIVLNDSLELAPGVYDVTALVTAAVGPQGSAKPLPEITSTISVR